MPTDPGEPALLFADSLMRQQRFRESELEYERYAFLHPNDPERMGVMQKMLTPQWPPRTIRSH